MQLVENYSHLIINQTANLVLYYHLTEVSSADKHLRGNCLTNSCVRMIWDIKEFENKVNQCKALNNLNGYKPVQLYVISNFQGF